MSEFYKQDYTREEMTEIKHNDSKRLVCPKCIEQKHIQCDCGDCDCKNLYYTIEFVNGQPIRVYGQCCCYSDSHK